MGRPTKCDAKVTAKIVRFVKQGNYLETACGAAGVDPKSARDWRKRGLLGEEPFAAFAKAVEAAEGEAERKAVDQISKAGAEDWRALAWRLERKNPKRWGFRVRVEVDEQLQAFLKKLKDRLPDDVFEQVVIAGADEVVSAVCGGDSAGQDSGEAGGED